MKAYRIVASVALPLSFLVAYGFTRLVGVIGFVNDFPWSTSLIIVVGTYSCTGFIAAAVIWGGRKPVSRHLIFVSVYFSLAVLTFAPVPVTVSGSPGLIIPGLILFVGPGTICPILKQGYLGR